MSLTLDFYESSKGETTVITFPDNGIGIIDAYPSKEKSRDDILKIIHGKSIHFICLTHPHEDHASDLVSVLKAAKPSEFWHTMVHDHDYYSNERTYIKFQHPDGEKYIEREKKAIQPLIELNTLVKKQKIEKINISSSTKSRKIAGVKIIFLAPSSKTVSDYTNKFDDQIEKQQGMINQNMLSSVIAFEYQGIIFLHGGDAEKSEWIKVYNTYKEDEKLSDAKILKVPHHGAWNAIFNRKDSEKCSKKNYIKLIEQNAYLIIFGNSNHPDIKVFKRLYNKSSNFYCLQNQFKKDSGNPLNLSLGINSPMKNISQSGNIICNHHVSLTIGDDGNIVINKGYSCNKNKICYDFTKKS